MAFIGLNHQKIVQVPKNCLGSKDTLKYVKQCSALSRKSFKAIIKMFEQHFRSIFKIFKVLLHSQKHLSKARVGYCLSTLSNQHYDHTNTKLVTFIDVCGRCNTLYTSSWKWFQQSQLISTCIISQIISHSYYPPMTV